MNPKKHRFFLGEALNWPSAFLGRILWKFGSLNRYEVIDKNIVLRRGLFSKRAISVPEIKSWSVHGEMGFDVIHIVFIDGECVTWIDKYGDLLKAMREVLPSKERELIERKDHT